jgi:hypothetical protein
VARIPPEGGPGRRCLHFNVSEPGLEGLAAAVGSDANNVAHELIDERIKAKADSQPRDSHVARMAALYVDVDEHTKIWNRPTNVTPAESGLLLQDVANDYAPRFVNLQSPPDERYEELKRAYLAWPDHPTLPEPARPDLSHLSLL